MIKEIKGMNMITVCPNCGEETTTNLMNRVVKKNQFEQWKTFNVECSCGSGQAFNLNIPENDTDEPFETGQIPVNEEVNRHNIRILQRLIREDFIQAKRNQ